jgi:phosphonate transport system substrate-binding protein
MFRKISMQVSLVIILLSLVSCAAAPTATPVAKPTATPAAVQKAFVLGDISADPATKIKAIQPLADYLAAHLSQFGITAGEVKVAPDQDTMIKWLKDGTVDLYFASPYPAMLTNDQAGAPIILRRWKGGVAEYKTVIYVRKDSTFKSLSDLKGHLIAFDIPSSTTGYMLPLAYILQAGLKASNKAGADSTVAPDEIGYVFATGVPNQMNWLITNKASAAGVSDQDVKDIAPDVMAQLTALVETEMLPRYLTLVRPDMQAAETDAVTTLLIGLDQTAEGPGILKTFEKTKKFDALPEPQAMLDRMHELYQLVVTSSK